MAADPGRRVRAFREARGWTQERFAAEYGLSPATGGAYVSKIERGLRPTPGRMARWMARIEAEAQAARGAAA